MKNIGNDPRSGTIFLVYYYNVRLFLIRKRALLFCELNSRARKRNDFLARAVKVPVEVRVKIASSSLLLASFVFYSFSSKRVLDSC